MVFFPCAQQCHMICYDLKMQPKNENGSKLRYKKQTESFNYINCQESISTRLHTNNNTSISTAKSHYKSSMVSLPFKGKRRKKNK